MRLSRRTLLLFSSFLPYGWFSFLVPTAHAQERPQGLVLPVKNLRENTAKLFTKLAQRSEARDEFVRNPTGVLTQEVLNRKLPPQQISDANRVLFAMLANDKFREWLDDYEVRPNGQRVNPDQFSRDFAKAVLEFGDSDLLRAIFKNAADGFGQPGSPSAEQLITGPEKSVATSPATPSTSDQSLHSSQNFNNKQTGIQFGDTSKVDPAFLRGVISQLIARAKALKAAGTLGEMRAHIR